MLLNPPPTRRALVTAWIVKMLQTLVLAGVVLVRLGRIVGGTLITLAVRLSYRPFTRTR